MVSRKRNGEGIGSSVSRYARCVVTASLLCIALAAQAQDRLNLRVSLNPSSVFGGLTSTGTVTLNQAAPSAGVTVTLASNNAAATVPASVTVASGQTSATFTVTTTTVTADTGAKITASFGKSSSSEEIRIQGLDVQSLTLTPTTVTGGNSSAGLVTLNGAAPSGGATVTLSTKSSALTIPSSVTVAAGASSATFAVTTATVSSQTDAQIKASLGSSSSSASLSVEPSTTFTIALASASVGGGSVAKGTITLSATAPKGGLEVALSSSSSVAFVEHDVRVDSGATTANFEVQTAGVATSTAATITASIGSAQQSATLTITPAILTSIAINPAAVGGGATPWGTVTLNGVAPTGGLVITLASNQTSVTVPATVTVQGGRSGALFPIKTSTVTSATVAAISAASGSVTISANLTVNPLAITSIGVFPGDVVGGNNAQGIVVLNSPAGTGGAVVTLASSDPSTTVPATVTVPAGSSKAKFTITTTSVTAQTPVTLTSTLGSSTQTTTLTVNAVSLDAVRVDPSRVVGGKTSTGTIYLDGPAPTGGLVVTLASNSTSATAPATVTVPAGQNSVTFLVQTTAVTASAKVQITATVGTTSVNTNLTVSVAGH